MARGNFNPVLVMRKQGTRPPLFCLYGFNGDVDTYFSLAKAAGDDQPVIGIRSPALSDLSRLPRSIEEAAAEVMGWIRNFQPQGVPALVGYSWAGLLAFEVARQFQETEGISCFTALVGTNAPIARTHPVSRVAHLARHMPNHLWDLMINVSGSRRQRLKRWIKMTHGLKQYVLNGDQPMRELIQSPISLHLLGLLEKYSPPPKSGKAMDLFREHQVYTTRVHPIYGRHDEHLPDAGWNHWTQNKNRIHWVAGDHETCIQPPFVSGLAQSLRKAFDQHAKQS